MKKDKRDILLNTVRQTIIEHKLFLPEDKLLVALSGGADSVALLLILQQLGCSVEALHCNFHLRGEESDRDESFVKNLCQKRDITLHVKHFDTTQYANTHKISIEMAARDLRYDWFQQMLDLRHANYICVAHHQQDQAETLLLNLLRGSGIRGLCGMHYKNGLVVRPLLDSNKEEILSFLKERKQTWMEDSTNQEHEALRNRIRLDILPLLQEINPQAIPHIALTAKHLQEVLPIYHQGVEKLNVVHHGAEEMLPFDQSTMLHEWLNGCGFTSSQEYDIQKASTGSIIESATHRLLRDRQVYVLQNKALTPPPLEVSITTFTREQIKNFQPGSCYFDADQIATPLSVRSYRQGDRIIPFGMKGSRLVSDVLTDLKLNLFEKQRQQVVLDAEGQIICIVGQRSSNLYPITQSTSRVLVIKNKERNNEPNS